MTRSRFLLALPPLLAALPAGAQSDAARPAWWSAAPLPAALAPSVAPGPEVPEVTVTRQDARPGYGTLLVGSALGYLLGAAAGAGVGYLVDSDAESEYSAPGSVYLGGFVGASLGASAGTHLASGRRGNIGWSLAANAAGLGLGLLAMSSNQTEGMAAGTPLFQVIGASLAEWATIPEPLSPRR